MANYTFRTPYVLEAPSGRHRLFYFANLRKGVTVVKSGATYSTIQYAVDSDLASYDIVYRGGYEYTVDDAAKAGLITGGVGVTEANFTAQ